VKDALRGTEAGRPLVVSLRNRETDVGDEHLQTLLNLAKLEDLTDSSAGHVGSVLGDKGLEDEEKVPGKDVYDCTLRTRKTTL
jgi:hypothetical protein